MTTLRPTVHLSASLIFKWCSDLFFFFYFASVWFPLTSGAAGRRQQQQGEQQRGRDGPTGRPASIHTCVCCVGIVTTHLKCAREIHFILNKILFSYYYKRRSRRVVFLLLCLRCVICMFYCSPHADQRSPKGQIFLNVFIRFHLKKRKALHRLSRLWSHVVAHSPPVNPKIRKMAKGHGYTRAISTVANSLIMRELFRAGWRL